MRSIFLLFGGLVLWAQSPPVPESARIQLDVAQQPSFGPADAPVTIVEFGDFECPSCRAEAPVLRELIPQLFPNKVRITFLKGLSARIDPPVARAASVAGRCDLSAGCARFLEVLRLGLPESGRYHGREPQIQGPRMGGGKWACSGSIGELHRQQSHGRGNHPEHQ